jgi:hypothetical protein
VRYNNEPESIFMTFMKLYKKTVWKLSVHKLENLLWGDSIASLEKTYWVLAVAMPPISLKG